MELGHDVLVEGSDAIDERTYGAAHGLALSANRPLPGLQPHAFLPLPEAFVDIGPDHHLLSSWRAGRAARTRMLRADGRAVLVERDQRGVHRVRLAGSATAVIDADARRIALVPEGDDWPRVLAAQVLPYAALTRGYEVVHATAVVRDGVAVVLAGAPGAGKSAIAGHLILDGAELLADEIVVLDRDLRGRVRAHPGVGLLHVREGAIAGLGLECTPGGAIALPVSPVPVPVGAVLLLEPDDVVADVEITRTHDAARLMPATFSLNLSSSERLRRHFEIREAIVAGAGLHRVRIPREMSAAEVAARL